MYVCMNILSTNLVDGHVYSIETCMRSREHLYVFIPVYSELADVAVVAL